MIETASKELDAFFSLPPQAKIFRTQKIFGLDFGSLGCTLLLLEPAVTSVGSCLNLVVKKNS